MGRGRRGKEIVRYGKGSWLKERKEREKDEWSRRKRERDRNEEQGRRNYIYSEDEFYIGRNNVEAMKAILTTRMHVKVDAKQKQILHGKE